MPLNVMPSTASHTCVCVYAEHGDERKNAMPPLVGVHFFKANSMEPEWAELGFHAFRMNAIPLTLTNECLQVILGGRCTGVWVDKVQASPI